MFKRTIAVITILAAVFCLAMRVDAAKPDNWLIYWYVCGTDIETTRIIFNPSSDLMSDDPSDLILADPDRRPGDATLCINEVERANLSPDIKIFMQAGGTYVWGHRSFRDNNAKMDTKPHTVAADNFLIEKGLIFREWSFLKNAKPVTNGTLSRYLYDKYHRGWNNLYRETLSISGEKDTETDMGSKVGLVSFLQAGQKLERELYPEGNVRRVFIFVDHGVTTLYGLHGVCTDEYTGNALSLKEIQQAFEEVKDGWVNPEEKPFEVVAFDACEMSTYETAVAVKDAANYMVASQEPMYGKVMFGYTDLLNELSKNTAMSGAELGKVICRTYKTDAKASDKKYGFKSTEILTMSVVDLSESKMAALETAYENFGAEARNFAQSNPNEFIQNFIKFNKAAKRAEKYPSDNYDNPPFVDLKDLAKNAGQNIPEIKDSCNALVSAINNAVIYQERGEALNRGGGLSIYYPFNLLNSWLGITMYQNFIERDKLTPKSQGELYGFFYEKVTDQLKITNIIDKETQQTVDRKYEIPAGSLFDSSSLKNVLVDVDADKKIAWVELDQEELQKIESVRAHLMYIRATNDKLQGFYLGSDSNIAESRTEPGKFESVFKNKWLRLNGQLVSVIVVSDGTKSNKHGKKVDGTELCVIPVQVNGQQRNLFVTCKYPSEKYTIIGWAPLPEPQSNETIIPKGELSGFNKGDVVTPLYVEFDVTKAEMEATSDKNESELGEYAMQKNLIRLVHGNPITIGDEPLQIGMGDRPLPDGNYIYSFEFVNPIGGENIRADEFAIFKVREGKVVDVKHSNNLEDIKDLS